MYFKSFLSSLEGRKGTWWKMGQDVYALWVSASANILSLAGRGRVLGVFVSLSWWLLVCCTLMVPGIVRQTCMASLKISQSGSRHCWIEKGVLLDLWTTPKLLIWIVV